MTGRSSRPGFPSIRRVKPRGRLRGWRREVRRARDAGAARFLRVLLPDEERLVQEWLRSPPADVDPAQVPAQHRRLFVEAAREAIEANGRVSEPERETLELLDQLLR